MVGIKIMMAMMCWKGWRSKRKRAYKSFSHHMLRSYFIVQQSRLYPKVFMVILESFEAAWLHSRGCNFVIATLAEVIILLQCISQPRVHGVWHYSTWACRTAHIFYYKFKFCYREFLIANLFSIILNQSQKAQRTKFNLFFFFI